MIPRKGEIVECFELCFKDLSEKVHDNCRPPKGYDNCKVCIKLVGCQIRGTSFCNYGFKAVKNDTKKK